MVKIKQAPVAQTPTWPPPLPAKKNAALVTPPPAAPRRLPEEKKKPCPLGKPVDPQLAGVATRYRPARGELFSVHGPSAADVQQGKLGDCWFLSALAALAHKHPDKVQEMVQAVGNDQYDVHFFRDGKPERVRVTGREAVKTIAHLAFPAYARPTDRDENAAPERWVPIAEKAFARFAERYLSGRPGYDALDGGYPKDALEALTGTKVTTVFVPLDPRPAWELLQRANAGDVVVASTLAHPQGEDIVPGHAYSVLGTFVERGEPYVTLRNPWGENPHTRAATIILSFAAFERSFLTVTAAPVQKFAPPSECH